MPGGHQPLGTGPIQPPSDPTMYLIYQLDQKLTGVLDFFGANGVGLIGELQDLRKSVDMQNRGIEALAETMGEVRDTVLMHGKDIASLVERMEKVENQQQLCLQEKLSSAAAEVEAVQARVTWWRDTANAILSNPLLQALCAAVAAISLLPGFKLVREHIVAFLQLPHK